MLGLSAVCWPHACHGFGAGLGDGAAHVGPVGLGASVQQGLHHRFGVDGHFVDSCDRAHDLFKRLILIDQYGFVRRAFHHFMSGKRLCCPRLTLF